MTQFRRAPAAFLICLGFLTVARPASADAISVWIDAAKALSGPPLPAAMDGTGRIAQAHAQVALAMFEAVNAIDRRYQSYLGFPRASATASQEVAAATAAHAILLAEFPASAATLNESLAFQLSQVADGPAKEAGREIGRNAAAAVRERTLIDESVQVPHYRPRTTAGMYIQPSMPALPMTAYVMKPWFMKTVMDVLPKKPPVLSSEQYARDYDEVRRLGGRASTDRTPAQTAAAKFWAGNSADLAVRILSGERGRSLVGNARFYALREMAVDDARCAITVAKYEFAFWRPVTAIRNADEDENPATTIDPAWVPLLVTPPFGEYPCGHCIGASVTAALVEAEFGSDARMVFDDTTMPGTEVTVTPREYVREVSMSRIYAGVHYRFSNDAAEEMGRRIAQLALQHMRPIRDGSNGGLSR